MKMYNKPVVEFTGIEVEDIITISGALGVDPEASAAFRQIIGDNPSDLNTEVLIYEW